MIEGEPSKTALEVAAGRAAHLRFDPEPRLLEDSLAEALLGPERSDLIDRYSNDGPWVLIENRLFLCLRARFVEDRLREAFARGVRQYVILGAGLDSFVFRQPFDGLQIFEIDHPSTQDWKRERLARLGWSLPANAQFVACDFERQTVSKALSETAFDPTQPSVVSWMGVVYYLAPETVDASLHDLLGVMAGGSELVLDSMRPWDELPPRYHALREAMAEYLSGAGEPQINRYREDEILETLRRAGFAEAFATPRAELTRRYLDPMDARDANGERIPLSERFDLVVGRTR